MEPPDLSVDKAGEVQLVPPDAEVAEAAPAKPKRTSARSVRQFIREKQVEEEARKAVVGEAREQAASAELPTPRSRSIEQRQRTCS